MSVDVVVIGNVGMDTCVYEASSRLGAESHYSRNRDFIGQAGAYCSRGFNRLGRKTAFLGHVGDDPWGRLIRETFHREGIDIRALWTDPEGTARSVNIMAPDGRRINYYDGRGHMEQRPDLELCAAVMHGAKLAHFHLSNWARMLLKPARDAGLCVSCDLQDVRDMDDPYRQDFIEEARILFFSSVNLANPETFMDYCFQRGPAQIIIAGMGNRGCALATREEMRYFDPVSLPDPVVDTNGAGDSLAVGFLTAHVLDGIPSDEAIRYGQTAARYVCTLKTGSDDLITTSRLNHLVRD